MALPGTGALVIWHRVDTTFDADYRDWHTTEHIPERVGLPGFRVGRRYSDGNPDPVYLTVYVADDADVFASASYRARLDDPTPETSRIQPSFRDFVRAAYAIATSAGDGPGDALAVVALSGGALPDGEAPAVCHRLTTMPGVVAAHHLRRTDVTERYRSAETDLRSDVGDAAPAALLLVEGTDRDATAHAVDQAALGVHTLFDLSVHLDEHDLDLREGLR